jgi:hypothetical protein
MLTGGSQLEILVFGESADGAMNTRMLGYLLAWNALLIKIESGRIKCMGNITPYSQVLSALTEFLELNKDIYEMLLISFVPFLPEYRQKNLTNAYKNDLANFAAEYCDLGSIRATKVLVLSTLINFMKSFPSSARKFYFDCDRQLTDLMLPYIKSVVSPAILENEIRKIEMHQLELGDNNELSFALYRSTNEIVATYTKSSEISAKISLKIPSDYPLKSITIDIGDQLRLKAQQARKWTLSIRNLI